MDTTARSRLLREIEDHEFNECAAIPMFWRFVEAAVNPKHAREGGSRCGDHLGQ
jgi:hypothetical protein